MATFQGSRLEGVQIVYPKVGGEINCICSITADLYEKRAPVMSIVSLLPTSSHHIQPFSFPEFAGPTPTSVGGVPDCMRDSPVETKPCNLADIKDSTPFADLKVGTYVCMPP